MVDKLSAADAAIRAHGVRGLSVMMFGPEGPSPFAPGFEPGTIEAMTDLLQKGPALDKLLQRHKLPLWRLGQVDTCLRDEPAPRPIHFLPVNRGFQRIPSAKHTIESLHQ